MGLFDEAFELIDTAGGTAPSGTGSISDLTGATGAAASLEGAKLQAESAREALEFQKEALAEQRELLDPFRQLGIDQIGQLDPGGGIVAPGSTAGLALGTQDLGLQRAAAPRDLSRFAASSLLRGAGEAQALGREVSTIQGLDPNVLNSPFFKAQQEEATRNLEQSAAARGRVGAGGTKDAIARQSLLLGAQFGQQDLEARLASQGQRFGQLGQQIGLAQGVRSTGLQEVGLAGQQNFANIQGLNDREFQAQLGINRQQFSQLSQSQQQDIANQLAVQQSEFGQRQSLVGLGQASAAGQAAGIQAGAGQSVNLLTGIGNAQAAGGIGAANALGQGASNIASIGGAALGFLAASDRRLKRNIQFKGMTPGGNKWYSFDYIWGESSEGVMADEVNQDFVVTHGSGYKMVDYSRIT